jgi:hypothetical protein
VFFPGSRYFNLTPYQITRPDGSIIKVAPIPLPGPALVLGYHRRLRMQRLDLIAYHFLTDPTMFWRLCNANDTVVPDALANRDLVGIPRDAPVTS